MELKIIKKLCDECIIEGESLLQTKWDDIQNLGHHERVRGTYVDLEKFSSWKSNCTLLLSILGHLSAPWLTLFERDINTLANYKTMLGGLRSIKNALDKGYLIKIEDLVYAEAFSSLIEQAEYLFEQNYNLAAGVICRAVLEEKLRNLCSKHGIEFSKPKPGLNDFNTELYKGKFYPKTEFKNIDYLITIGNNAAHYKPIMKDEINKLICGVKEILTRYN